MMGIQTSFTADALARNAGTDLGLLLKFDIWRRTAWRKPASDAEPAVPSELSASCAEQKSEARPAAGVSLRGLAGGMHRLAYIMTAAKGVALGPDGTQLKRGGFTSYLDRYAYLTPYEERLDHLSPGLLNPSREEILPVMLDQLRDLPAKTFLTNRFWRYLPWAPERPIEYHRLVATLISFSNDHNNEIAKEFFPAERIRDFLARVVQESKNRNSTLNVCSQFRIALSVADGHPIGAAVIAALAYRAIARLWDSRADPLMRFSAELESENDVDAVKVGLSTSLFHYYIDPRDPLADTYHFWTNILIGMFTEFEGGARPVGSALCRTAFYFGPDLMHLVRIRMFGVKQIAGVHKYEDRMGMWIGVQIARNIISHAS